MKLKDRVALVTGGASGIGAATCRLFADEGAVVVVADRDLQAAEQLAANLGAAGHRAEAVAVDVRRSAEVKGMIDGAVARHGRLDVLVNNAGYGFAATVVDTDEDAWEDLMAVNVRGVFLGCKHAIPVMAARGGGVIVNTASVASFVGLYERACYCASKGAVAALTRAVALDHVDQNIRVNAVAPGTIATPYFDEIYARSGDAAAYKRQLEARHPMNRLGTPEEIAKAILYLASDDSSYCTGSILLADGGLTAR
jgi:NAD(P)-dependent dehydrogenase (short-subunit alcohol dehydrogenase family)